MNNEPKELITDEFKKDLRDYLDAFSAWKAAFVMDPATGKAAFPGTNVTLREIAEALIELDTDPESIGKLLNGILDRHPALTRRDLEYCLLLGHDLDALVQLAKGAKGKND